ncbi:hypothetical protein EV283_3393 [Sphingomonas sp. BK036]|nr:hypothetical protein EV283_3393 [Sphingomonas sp. BK036]
MDRSAGHRSRTTARLRCAVLLMAIGSGVGLTGCTGQKLAKLAVCDGKHLRPGNPYGSILPGAPIPATIAPTGPGVPIAASAPPAATGFRTSAAYLVAPSPGC